jgi:hypothetical protein
MVESYDARFCGFSHLNHLYAAARHSFEIAADCITLLASSG